MKPKQAVSRLLVVALREAIFALALVPAAQAADATGSSAADEALAGMPSVEELVQPSSSVELGAGYVDADSYKFGEYNGLGEQGGHVIGNVDLRGGGRYDSDDATRWRITGTDLGLETRDLAAEYGRQGRFRIDFGYDELRRNRSDSYQTPYLGAGGNNLTLPSTWVVPVVPRVNGNPNARGLSQDVAQSSVIVGGVLTPPTPAQSATSNALIAADLPAFRKVDLDTLRKRTDLGLSTLFNPNWEFKASFRHEDKNGLKSMSTNTRQTGSDIAAVIPDLIDQSTDQLNVGVNFTGDNSFLQIQENSSLFSNKVSGMTWQNWAKLTTPNVNTISSAPGNQFHQLGLTGGYNFTKTTRLVVDAAYSRSTQNESFLTDATVPVVPVSSPDALVVGKSLNLKLTGKPNRDLSLAAAYKFDERDNRTPVNTYQFSDNNLPVAPLNTFGGAVVAQNANANLPYSKRVNKIGLDADYRLSKGQWLKGGYEYLDTHRWCDGTWIDCVEAANTKENTLRIEYRNNFKEDVSGRIGYEHARRTVDNYNENAFLALVPFANVSPDGAPGGATAYGTMTALGVNGWGRALGLNPAAPPGSAEAFFFPNNSALNNALYANENRISELPGMRLYNLADRNRDKLRTAVNWQASERLALQTGVNYSNDDYEHSAYGLKESRNWSLDLDASLEASDRLSIGGFFTHEDQHAKSAGNTYTANSTATSVNGATAISGNGSCAPGLNTIALRNASNKIDPCLDWTADLHDQVDTLGISLQHKGLLHGKLKLAGDVAVTWARSGGSFTGGNYANNPYAGTADPTGTIAAYYIPATPLPAVTSKTFDLRLVGDYTIDKQRTVRVGYAWSRLVSVDWAYEGMQPGGLTQLLPSYETAPNYSVQAVAVSFIYNFR